MKEAATETSQYNCHSSVSVQEQTMSAILEDGDYAGHMEMK
jgi:hypothetical protein